MASSILSFTSSLHCKPQKSFILKNRHVSNTLFANEMRQNTYNGGRDIKRIDKQASGLRLEISRRVDGQQTQEDWLERFPS